MKREINFNFSNFNRKNKTVKRQTEIQDIKARKTTTEVVEEMNNIFIRVATITNVVAQDPTEGVTITPGRVHHRQGIERSSAAVFP